MESVLTAINRSEVLKYLRYRGGTVPEETEAQIREGMDTVLRTARPRYRFQLFDIDRTDGLRLAGTSFALVGEDIAGLLAACDRCVLLAATLGNELESLLRRAQLTDMARAVILDACSSSAIENVCDNIEAEILKQLPGMHQTDRFSPGYGDMPITVQREFCEVMDTARKIGLTVSASGIMIPRKSVTAILGIADKPQPKRFRGCEHCSLFENCVFRKDGKTCGKA
ncbi:MAG: hypothetical protein AB7C89_07160 [Intestinibacillus sp.]